MTSRIGRSLLATVALVWAAACAPEKEPATEQIRALLAVPAAVEPAAETPGEAADEAGLEGPDPAAARADSGAVVSDSVAATTLTLPAGDTLGVSDAVARYYRDRSFVPKWTDADGLLPEGEQMLAALGSVREDGLDPDQYGHTAALDLARRLESGEIEERDAQLEAMASLDLVLTEGYVRAGRALVMGTVDPESGGVEWRIDRGEAPPEDLLAELGTGAEPAAMLASLRPRNHHYDLMRQALARYRAIQDAGGWSEVPEGETLKPGDRDPRVAALRNRLMAGDDPEEARLARTGLPDPLLFDDDLAEAVERFQKRHDLHEDGALGPNTLASLNVPVEDRVETLLLNLDRWRWLPNDLGDKYIMVNVAGFEMEFVVDGDAVESMNVVVGRTANRTPIFQDTLEYMVVNPYWNVPTSIARDEILPAAQRDPGYLARNNYEVMRNGRVVSPISLDADALSSGYSIRQRPGRGNALGDVKFLFPNDMDIYLHDTPADHLFTQKSRAFSHGCIRVERPADLARTLLEHLSDRDPSEYDRLRTASGEQWVTFDEKIPVYILYFTAWVNDDGTVRFHQDVYDRDRTLEVESIRQLVPADPRTIAASRGDPTRG